MPKEMLNFEISPADFTASAIVKLFNKIVTNNQTYHVANKYLSNLSILFADYPNISVKTVPINKFLDVILTKLDDPILSKQMELFMLHQGWLEMIDIYNMTKTIILQDKTDYILNNFGFKWIPITGGMLSEFIQQAI